MSLTHKIKCKNDCLGDSLPPYMGVIHILVQCKHLPLFHGDSSLIYGYIIHSFYFQENEVICRCGDTFGGYRRAPLDQCKKPCPGNKGKIPFCGSIERQMVFLTVAKEG